MFSGCPDADPNFLYQLAFGSILSNCFSKLGYEVGFLKCKIYKKEDGKRLPVMNLFMA